MSHSRNRAGRRLAAIAPLTVLLLIPLVGMLAFSVDVGYMVLVQSELQNAADAAALAGAEKLQDLYVRFYTPGQTQQSQIYNTATANTGTSDCPKYTAEKYAAYNKAGNVAITVPDADVTFGYQDGSGATQAAAFPDRFPNTITVVTRRDSKANTPLNLFFGSLFNKGSVNLTATATATVFTGEANSLTVIPGVNAHILPVALDINVWKNFLATGQSGDGTVHADANGVPQLYVYPNPGNAPGSFGLIDVGPPANNTPAFSKWIDDGDTPNDVKYLVDNHLVPASTSAPQWWKAGPGMKAGLLSDFQSVIGQPNLIPLFVPYQASPYQATRGEGSNAQYQVVGFVSVTVSQAEGHGSGMDISVQPMALVDPTVVLTNLTPARPGTGTTTTLGPLTTTFTSAKLTQ
jgi:Flp pilus assembly protein TadG